MALRMLNAFIFQPCKKMTPWRASAGPWQQYFMLGMASEFKKIGVRLWRPSATAPRAAGRASSASEALLVC